MEKKLESCINENKSLNLDNEKYKKKIEELQIDNEKIQVELNELKENLKNMGLNFGMKLPDWPPQNLDDLLKIKNKEFV